jgi:putative ABC transport system substrate-binding protein
MCKKLFLKIGIGIGFWVVCFGTGSYAYALKIAITQYVSHGALDAVRQGVEERVKECLKETPVEFSVTNASGNLGIAQQVAHQAVSDGADVIVAISTISAQTVVSAARGKIPVVFAAITDPKSAQIEGPTVTGVSDKPPFKMQLNFVQELIPRLKNLAILYNPGEDNSLSAVKELEALTKEKGINLISIAVSKVTDIPQAVVKATESGVEAVFIANDNLIASSFESLIRAAEAKKIPVFASDILLVDRGAIGMRGISYFKIGKQAGDQVCQILNKTAPSDIPVATPVDLELKLNVSAAKNLGIQLPKALLKEAGLDTEGSKSKG